MSQTEPSPLTLAGELARNEKGKKGAEKYNNGELGDFIAGMIDIGRTEKNKQEAMKIKLPGTKEVIELSATQGLTWTQQLDLVVEAQVISGGTIIMFNQLTGEKGPYKIDEDQVHAAIANSFNRYSSESTTYNVWNRSFEDLLRENKPKYNGMDILIVNVDIYIHIIICKYCIMKTRIQIIP